MCTTCVYYKTSFKVSFLKLKFQGPLNFADFGSFFFFGCSKFRKARCPLLLSRQPKKQIQSPSGEGIRSRYAQLVFAVLISKSGYGLETYLYFIFFSSFAQGHIKYYLGS